MGKLITDRHFDTWHSMLDMDVTQRFRDIEEMPLEPHSFTFCTSVSVMSSSRIEGEQMEVDSYVKHKLLSVEYLPELTEKPNDLYAAYLHAKDSRLSQAAFHEAHRLISAHLLPAPQRGTLRTTEMLVMEHGTSRIQYEATPRTMLDTEYTKLWQDITDLLAADLTVEQAFYHAAFIHMVFVNIHPFGDGNGRSARLLEKWFLAEKLGERAWYIQSELHYYRKVSNYYLGLNRLGQFYGNLDYAKAIPFLLMLPQSLVEQRK